MHAYSQCLSPPFVSTLLIMYTHESITGHCGLSYHHFAAFIQCFFSNNFWRRTRRQHHVPIYYYNIVIYVQCKLNFSSVLIPTSIRNEKTVVSTSRGC